MREIAGKITGYEDEFRKWDTKSISSFSAMSAQFAKQSPRSW